MLSWEENSLDCCSGRLVWICLLVLVASHRDGSGGGNLACEMMVLSFLLFRRGDRIGFNGSDPRRRQSHLFLGVRQMVEIED